MIRLLLFLVLCLTVTAPARAERAPDVTLRGVMTGAQHQTYVELPFRVPAGVERITVEFEYTGKDQRSVIDLGLRDPDRVRGWSGGNKSRFTIAETDATPSYLPGPLKPGTWRLLLGAPNIRKDSRPAYVAKIWFDRKGAAFAGFSDQTATVGGRWWRGDLHMHTGHSDGTCLSRKGARIPCPVFKTLDAAVARGLDFVAVTDHNTTSHFDALRELAPYYDDLLILPGREITTFYGHANLFGATGPLEFQLGSPRAPTFDTVLDAADAAGGLLALNHPGLPSGELCMGCGWTAPNTDYSRVPVIEVINGAISSGPLSGVPFWEQRLNEGHRITAIGGSDNHDATLDPGKAPAIGLPTTVVHAVQLDAPSILAAIRAGHVFVDVEGSRDRLLEVTAQSGEAKARMGCVLAAPAGATVRVSVRAVGVAGAVLSPAGNAAHLIAPADRTIASADAEKTLLLTSDGAPRWLRIDVRSATGKLLLLGNPVYLRAAR